MATILLIILTAYFLFRVYDSMGDDDDWRGGV